MSIEAMKQALEALGIEDMACRYEEYPTPEYIANAITTLRTAIEAAEKQEPAPVQEQIERAKQIWREDQQRIAELSAEIDRLTTAQPAPVQEPVAWVNAVMEQAQVFASAWSLVGGRFDDGSAIDDAEEAKAELRAMLTTPPAAPVPREHITDKFCWCQPVLDYKDPDTGAEVWVHNEPH